MSDRLVQYWPKGKPPPPGARVVNTDFNHHSDLIEFDEMPDDINHPPHYTHAGEVYETIKVIEAWGLGYHLGNVVKYISRAPHKGDELGDLRKAQWYLAREIERLEMRRTSD